MTSTLPGRNPELSKIWEAVFRLPIPLQRESCLFLIVSVLDVLMTYLLLEDVSGVAGRAIFYESNPVAQFFLERWDLRGIVYFKFATVGLVEVIAHLVATKNIVAARRLLEFGTLVVSVVVIYSLVLLLMQR